LDNEITLLGHKLQYLLNKEDGLRMIEKEIKDKDAKAKQQES
jgi:hypothetical protein